MNAQIHQLLEGKIDFIGQKHVDLISRIVLIATTIVSFIVGFVTQSLSLTFYIFGASTVVLLLVVVPPWPVFNRHPVKWLAKVNGKSS